MRTAGREVDKLLLMDAEDRAHAAAEQQSQVGERAEPPVADQDIAGFQRRMDAVDLGHVVRPQRGRDDVQQQAGPGVEQCQDLGDGEAAAGRLVAGLAEMAL